MTTYLIINALLTGFMTLSWNTTSWANSLCKMSMALTSLGSTFYAAQMLGYIVKV